MDQELGLELQLLADRQPTLGPWDIEVDLAEQPELEVEALGQLGQVNQGIDMQEELGLKPLVRVELWALRANTLGPQLQMEPGKLQL